MSGDRIQLSLHAPQLHVNLVDVVQVKNSWTQKSMEKPEGFYHVYADVFVSCKCFILNIFFVSLKTAAVGSVWVGYTISA